MVNFKGYQENPNVLLHAASGSAGNFAVVNKFGHNSDIDTAAEETVWDGGGDYPWSSLTSAQALEIVSSDVNDTAAGTGARTVEVQGLDSDYGVQTETVTLNGTTAVDLTNTYLRVFRLKVLTAGSGGENAGIITLRLDGAGATVGQITAANNQSLMAVYTIPAGKTALMTSYYASLNRSVTALCDIKIWVRPEGQVFQIKHWNTIDSSSVGIVSHSFNPHFKIPSKCDLYISADTSANNTAVSAGFDLLLIND